MRHRSTQLGPGLLLPMRTLWVSTSDGRDGVAGWLSPDGRDEAGRSEYATAMFDLWLFLHILGAIAAFGFGFYAPIFGSAITREAQYSDWYLRTFKRVSNGVIVPVAISMLITGTLLVMESGGMRRFEQLWLTLSLVLYVIALLVIFLAQRPTLNRTIALTAQPAQQPAGSVGTSANLAPNVKKLQLYAMILLVLSIAIVALMVWKPGS